MFNSKSRNSKNGELDIISMKIFQDDKSFKREKLGPVFWEERDCSER